MAVSPDFISKGRVELYNSRLKTLEKIVDKALTESHNTKRDLIEFGSAKISVGNGVYTPEMVSELAPKYIALGWDAFTYYYDISNEESYVKIVKVVKLNPLN
jgi:hypothetical protein